MQDRPAARDASALPLQRAAQTAARTRPIPQPGAELTIVVPTFQERDNIAPLVARLDAALGSIRWEVVFVDDDSPDGTAVAVLTLACTDRRVRIVQRLGRRGLAGAAIEGMLSSSAPYVAVMDADLQHDETLLPHMLARLKGEPLDLVIASRYAVGASTGGWSRRRQLLSRLGIRSARLLLRQQPLHDPLSGFFMLRRAVFEACSRQLSPQGFKILLDILASSPQPLRLAEMPSRFAPREHGKSKLDVAVAWHFAALILEKLAGRLVPARFLLFCMVGASGVVVQLAALGFLYQALPFAGAQACVVLLAMSSDYLINNAVTYRDQRLRGREFWVGLVSFYVVCGAGALANVGVGTLLYVRGEVWWLAGLASAIVGAAWNYGATRLYTWKSLRR